MGNIVSNVYNTFYDRGVSRKRRLDEPDGYSDENSLEKVMHTPKRLKLTCTTEYIYQALFQEGRNSDVTVTALGKEWKLHKVYLSQSQYFGTMFGGRWKETDANVISLEITDPLITIEALYIVFGSLYRDEVSVEPAYATSVVAAATLFQMDGLLEQCTDVMVESVNLQTVIGYYYCATNYGVLAVKEACLNWLLVNLLITMPEKPNELQNIGPELMEQLICNPNLVVIQTEFSLYVLLKLWLYMRTQEADYKDAQTVMLDAHRFYQNRRGLTTILQMEEYAEYIPVFQALRMQHMINHHLDVDMIYTDNIVPEEWIQQAIRSQWCSLLRIDQGVDKGPTEISEAEFNSKALRWGRTLTNSNATQWRWTGFNFGLDLIMSFDSSSLFLKRHHRPDTPSLIAYGGKRNVMYRVSVHCVNEQKQVKLTKTSGIQTCCMIRNSDATVLRLGDNLTYPLLVSLHIMSTTPYVAAEQFQPSD